MDLSHYLGRGLARGGVGRGLQGVVPGTGYNGDDGQEAVAVGGKALHDG